MSDIRNPENPAHLSALITKYCAEVEEKLNEATDYATALGLKETLCSRFQEECESSLVVSATRQYIDTVLRNRWGKRQEESGSRWARQ